MLILADPRCHPKHGLTQVTWSSQQWPTLQMQCRRSGEVVMLLHPLLGLQGCSWARTPRHTLPVLRQQHLQRQLSTPTARKRPVSGWTPPPHTPGSSTDSIAISRGAEQASVSEGLRRTKAASPGLLSRLGNNGFGVRGWSAHTRREEYRGQATARNSA